MNFYNTLEVCLYLSLADLYNLLISDLSVFNKYAVSKMMIKKKNNISDYDKLLLFYNNPEVAVKLFNFRHLCNKMFKCITSLEICKYSESNEFGSNFLGKYEYIDMFWEDEIDSDHECFDLLLKILRKSPELVKYIDDKVFGNRYFVINFAAYINWDKKNWNDNDKFIHEKIMTYLLKKQPYFYNDWIDWIIEREIEKEDEFRVNCEGLDYETVYEMITERKRMEYDEIRKIRLENKK